MLRNTLLRTAPLARARPHARVSSLARTPATLRASVSTHTRSRTPALTSARVGAMGLVSARGFSADAYQYETILVEQHDQVALVKLNRPKALNALNTQVMQEVVGCFEKLDKDEDIGVIVITGNERAFAAGADIKEMANMSFHEMYKTDHFGQWADIMKINKPIISAVNGFALGGGCELAMMCDIMIAGDSAKFGQPEVKIGVIPGMGGTQRLTRAVGKSKSMYMNLTGEFVSAEEMEKSGLVLKVVPADQLLDETMKIANKIAGMSRVAVGLAKEATNKAYEMSLREGLHFEKRLFFSLFSTEDQKEGMAAFVDKRDPTWKHK